MKRVLLVACTTIFTSCASPQSSERVATAEAPAPAPRSPIETLAGVDVPPGNIAVSPQGNIYFTVHQFFSPEFPVATLLEGSATPVLSELGLVSPLGIAIDSAGTVWLLDNGLAQEGAPPRLLAHATSGVTRTYELTEAAREDSFVNDLVIDLENRTAYIADPAGGADAALIVLDLRDGSTRRVLEGHVSVIPEDLDLIIDGEPVTLGTGEDAIRPRIGVNPIAADSAYEWLYFGPMHGTAMYRVRTADLRNGDVGEAELRKRVERYADKPICDGITMDGDGNIYLGDLANNAIGVIDSNGAYRVLESGPELSWVDAFAIGPDGKVYTVANQLHRAAPLHRGTDVSEPPFLVMRFDPVGNPVGPAGPR